MVALPPWVQLCNSQLPGATSASASSPAVSFRRAAVRARQTTNDDVTIQMTTIDDLNKYAIDTAMIGAAYLSALDILGKRGFNRSAHFHALGVNLHRRESSNQLGFHPCSGQVISDSEIDFFDVDSRSKALGDKLPSVECSRVLL